MTSQEKHLIAIYDMLEKDVKTISTYVEKTVLPKKWDDTKYRRKIECLNHMMSIVSQHLDLIAKEDEEICRCTTARVKDVFDFLALHAKEYASLSVTECYTKVNEHLTEKFKDAPQRCGLCKNDLTSLIEEMLRCI